MVVAVATILHGCAWNWDERVLAEISASYLEWNGLPVAAAGPQPFGSREGKCYFVYKAEIRDLSDDSLVASVVPTGGRMLTRAVMLDGRGVLAVTVSPASSEPEKGLAWKCDLVKIRDNAEVEAFCPGQGQVSELSGTSPGERVVLAIQTGDHERRTDSVIAVCDARDGNELLRQEWDVRDLRGLDSTPDGDLFVCAGYVDGVQGVYVGRASVQAVPALQVRNAQYPSISADGSTIAMSPCDPTQLWDRAQFREKASVTVLRLSTGEAQEVAIAANALVCGTRYVENPTRLLVYGMRAEANGKAVWWVIWTIGSDGVASELRKWKCERGEIVL